MPINFNYVIHKPEPIIIVGPPGPEGPPGPPGLYYYHDQSTASDVWTINHNFDAATACRVFTVGGKEMLAEVLNVSTNQIQVFFDSPTAGYAVCS